MYVNYDEYMRAIIGESPTNINRYPLQTNIFNTYNRQDINIPEPTLDTINLISRYIFNFKSYNRK